ncbi:MAG: formylglycine-generating enzyme family protein [Candidatus Cloacimonetes bacterium]|nr:formylglycine-generating enzyme family protein [Candidatus Cloacimonadota bacterium]
MKKYFIILAIALLTLSAYAIKVENVTCDMNNGIVEISFDVVETEYDCEITVVGKEPGSSYFNIFLSNGDYDLTGDWGDFIYPTTNMKVYWDPADSGYDVTDQYRFKIIAREQLPPPPAAAGLYADPEDYFTSFLKIDGTDGLADYYLDRFEVTQADYEAVMEYVPMCDCGIDYGFGPDYPVFSISWNDAVAYSNLRSLHRGLTPFYKMVVPANDDYLPEGDYGYNPYDWPEGWDDIWDDTVSPGEYDPDCVCESFRYFEVDPTVTAYRLPTDAMWQHAATGGNYSQNYTYSGGNDIDAVAWYYGNSGQKSHIVGTKAPNELGLYDMSGNVWEVVCDPYLFGNTPVARIIRGGYWGTQPNLNFFKPNHQDSYNVHWAEDRQFYNGFRLMIRDRHYPVKGTN